MKQANSEKLRLQWRLILLVYLLIATLISTGISFAKYTTSGEGSGYARVAAFNMTTSLSSTTQILNTTDGTASYTHSFAVTNSSEVAVNCGVTVSGIPSGVTATCKVGSTDKGAIANGSTITVGALAPDGTSETITLTFSVAKSTKVSATDISITVNAVQID